MKKVSIDNTWQMKICGTNVYQIKDDLIPAKVPGSVYGNLLEQGLIPDPYYRANELDALKLMECDFIFLTEFDVTPSMLEADRLFLRFDGIDTLSDIFVNGRKIGHTDNMHRYWEYSLEGLAHVGANELKVQIYSPTKFIKKENEKIYTGGSHECMEGFPHLRKAHCMFGWDWGPRLPDAGIFRPVYLIYGDKAGISSVRVDEKIENIGTGDCRAYITPVTEIDCFKEDVAGLSLTYELFAPSGEKVCETKTASFAGAKALKKAISSGVTMVVDNPKLWWPNGYGEHPLYVVKTTLFDEKGNVLDEDSKRIGLRTLTVNTGKDEWGESFAFEVNGVKIFAFGADYIPEDNILSRVTPERTRHLLEDAVMVNHNNIRVWGGGYYPNDDFFDSCDELGLIVWQDFMFACASYELDDAFEANIREEVAQNVRRIRHHACLGVWCGNNEMETQTLDGAWRPSDKQKEDYIKIFERIIPEVVKEEDPNGFYWPSSPSSGGNWDNPWDEDRGDAHYWDVWHGNKPFTDFRKHNFRFMSEFGFQSFPSMRTIRTFAEEKDLNVFSRVMEMHQRNAAANGKILGYLADTYLYPKDFEHLVYASQLLQAEAIRYGIEHFRRNRGRCMGTVVWQLNDIWPVASWSGIDYYGRWKALHYIEKRAFAPILLSCEETGELSERRYCIEEPHEIEKSVRVYISNETFDDIEGTLYWALRRPDCSELRSGEISASSHALSSDKIISLDFSDCDELNSYFTCRFVTTGGCTYSADCLFTAPKHFGFEDPGLSVLVNGDIITVSASAFAKNVEIYSDDSDFVLSDNFFDLEKGSKEVRILRGSAGNIKARSVYDMA